MEIPEGKKIVEKFSHHIPDSFVSCCAVWVENKKWWKFWLPSQIVRYTVLADK